MSEEITQEREREQEEFLPYHTHVITKTLKQRVEALELRLEELEEENRKYMRRRKK